MSDLLDTVKKAVGLANDNLQADAKAARTAIKADEKVVQSDVAQTVDAAKTLEKQLPITVWMRFGEMEAHALTVLHHAEQVATDALHSEEQKLLADMQKAMQAVRDVGARLQDWAKNK